MAGRIHPAVGFGAFFLVDIGWPRAAVYGPFGRMASLQHSYPAGLPEPARPAHPRADGRRDRNGGSRGTDPVGTGTRLGVGQAEPDRAVSESMNGSYPMSGE